MRISKADLPFRKGYKQTFTNEVFEIYDIPTTNPPTYSLIDASQEPLKGKIYELELLKVRDNSSEMTKHEWIHGSLSFISIYEYFSSKHVVLFQKLFQWKNNLEGDWRVALSEIIFPAKMNQVNKSDLEILKALSFMRKVLHLMLSPDHTEDNELLLELVPMKTVTIFWDPWKQLLDCLILTINLTKSMEFYSYFLVKTKELHFRITKFRVY